MRKSEIDLIGSNVYKSITLFAIPIFLSNLFQQLYNTVDSLIVGNFIGGQALAAVGSSGSLIFLLTGFVNGVSLGAGVIIARHFGEKDDEKLSLSIHTTVALGLVFGLALTVLGVFLTPVLLRWMGTPSDVIGSSIAYFRTYFLGCIAVVMYNCGSSILQSVGDSRHPMIYLITASFVNVLLDLLFIGVLGMGVFAAALATIISQSFSAMLCFIRLFRAGKQGKNYGVHLRKIGFEKTELKAIIRQGIPSGVQNSVISIANVIVQSNINAFGSLAMAGCGAFSKIEGFAFLPVTCFSISLATFVSQNLGARKMDRVRKGIVFGCISGMVIAQIIGLLIVHFSPLLIGLFSSEPEVIEYGVRECHVAPYFFCLLAFSHLAAGSLRGFGKPEVPMIVMLGDWCLLRITYITVMVRFIKQIEVIFWAYPLTWSISSIIFFIYMYSNIFRKNRQE